MSNRGLNISFIIIVLTVSLNLYAAQEMQKMQEMQVKSRKFYALSIPENVQYLIDHNSNLVKAANSDDIDFVLKLLVRKFVAVNGQENIEIFLQEMNSVPKNILNKLENFLGNKHGYKGKIEELSYRQLVSNWFDEMERRAKWIIEREAEQRAEWEAGQRAERRQIAEREVCRTRLRNYC